MKKIIVIVLFILLAFSLDGFSQGKSSKKPQPDKTEQVSKRSNKKGSRPKKPVRKRIHRRGTMRHGHKVRT